MDAKVKKGILYIVVIFMGTLVQQDHKAYFDINVIKNGRTIIAVLTTVPEWYKQFLLTLV